MIELESVPQLNEPVLIAAFEGWNDAGEAATAAIEHLEQTWQATPLASLDPDEYYDFQVNRPLVSIDDDGKRSLQWPTTRLSLAHHPDLGRDIVLLRGIEPNMRWRGFCAELLGVAAELGVEQIVTLGALLADVPHTRPV
ncbi:PAC2 family protein, partial [Phytoactinopolyspora endophytica]|uniref:PAC2 family protein n=1 Tax=Phytoactinopolyspora endophytica TaxID=1642495 RepID=UPI001F0F556E